MQLSCLYHPYNPMIVTDDEVKYSELIASGMWFTHPNEAKLLRTDYEQEKRLHDAPRKRKRNGGQKTQNVGIPAQ